MRYACVIPVWRGVCSLVASGWSSVMQTQPSSPYDFWARTRVPRITFLIGLILGLVMGWFFHGVISLIIRLGILLIFLVPLAIAVYFWFRLRNQNPTNTGTGM